MTPRDASFDEATTNSSSSSISDHHDGQGYWNEGQWTNKSKEWLSTPRIHTSGSLDLTSCDSTSACRNIAPR